MPRAADDRRNLAVGQGEGGLFDLGARAVLADRLDQALDAGAGASSEYCLARLPNSAGLAAARAWTFWAFSAVVQTISRALTAGAVFHLERLGQLLLRGPSRSPASFRSARLGQMMSLAYCSGLMPRSCSKQLQPLIDGQTEALGHLLDFVIDLVARDGDPLAGIRGRSGTC